MRGLRTSASVTCALLLAACGGLSKASTATPASSTTIAASTATSTSTTLPAGQPPDTEGAETGASGSATTTTLVPLADATTYDAWVMGVQGDELMIELGAHQQCQCPDDYQDIDDHIATTVAVSPQATITITPDGNSQPQPVTEAQFLQYAAATPAKYYEGGGPVGPFYAMTFSDRAAVTINQIFQP